MRRSTEFDATVKQGLRSAQPDIVLHARRRSDDDGPAGPRIGLVIGRSVGSAVDRHRVARRLRHVARKVLPELDAADRLVIRALPGSRHAMSAVLEQQLRTALQRIAQRTGVPR